MVITSVDPKKLSELFEKRVVIEKISPPLIIRLDGFKFRKFLSNRPLRDQRVHSALIEGCRKLMKFFNAEFCHIVSDEVNLYVLRSLPYGGRTFKILSISSAILSSSVSMNLGLELYFDARILVVDKPTLFIPYLLYRARVGYNNYVSKLYTSMVSKSTKKLKNMIEELEGLGIRISLDWRSTGSCLFIDYLTKDGVNPLTKENVIIIRRTINCSDDMAFCISKLMSIVNTSRTI